MDIATPLTFEDQGGRSEGAVAGWSWDYEDLRDDKPRELIRSLRFRITISYVLFFGLFLVLLGVFVKRALEVILDGIVEYARQWVSPEAAPLWTLIREDRAAHLTLLFDVPPNPPVNGLEKRGESVNGKGTKRAAHGKPKREEPVNAEGGSREPLGLRLSREAARALGGDLEVNRANGQTAVVLTLPVEEKLET
jgi:hypothetical protein